MKKEKRKRKKKMIVMKKMKTNPGVNAMPTSNLSLVGLDMAQPGG